MSDEQDATAETDVVIQSDAAKAAQSKELYGFCPSLSMTGFGSYTVWGALTHPFRQTV